MRSVSQEEPTERPPAAARRGASFFVCPWCGSNSQQDWSDLVVVEHYDNGDEPYFLKATDTPMSRATQIMGGPDDRPTWARSTCFSCKQSCMWRGQDLIYPEHNPFPDPSPDMQLAAKALFIEARDVAPRSRRAAAALGRASLEALLKEIRPALAGRLDDRIAGLHDEVSTTLWAGLTVLRHAGNKALHGTDGDIDDVVALVLDDADGQTLGLILNTVNQLTDELITRPKQTAALFGDLPSGVAEAALAKAGVSIPLLSAGVDDSVSPTPDTIGQAAPADPARTRPTAPRLP